MVPTPPENWRAIARIADEEIIENLPILLQVLVVASWADESR
jgi:hypothetical protein